MREIKFRAWDSREKEMVMPNDICRLHFNDGFPYCVYTWNGNMILRKDFILMQYTGLKDKSRVEIYEGDILKDQWNNRGVVEWIVPGFEWLGKKELPQACFWESLEKIGNIYENPELLK